jgi:hypothetical protein
VTDLELLALSAKAAGYDIRSDAWACKFGGGKQRLFMGNDGPEWNPLDDDGDALRLALKLGISIQFSQFSGDMYSVGAATSDICCLFAHEDRMIDIRHDIVLAAAEVGKKAVEAA